MLPATPPLPIDTWLPHDGSATCPIPADLPVLCRGTDGRLIARYSDMVLWQHVTAYLIEETPESAAADLAAKFSVATADVSAAYDEMLAAASDLTSDRYAVAKARFAALCPTPAGLRPAA